MSLIEKHTVAYAIALFIVYAITLTVYWWLS